MNSFIFNHSFLPSIMCKKSLNSSHISKRASTRRSFFECSRDLRKVSTAVSNKLINIGVTGVNWTTYRVNALYDFKYGERNLYEYEMILGEHVKKKILELETNEFENIKFSIETDIFPEIAVTKMDKPAIKITIEGIDLNAESTDEVHVYFTAILLSVERNEGINETERLENSAVILPLVLVDYEHKLFLQSFIDFLEDNFSCIVSPLEFSSTDLKWMLTLFTSSRTENIRPSTGLEYEVPSKECEFLDYGIATEEVIKAWNKVMEPDIKKGKLEITEDKMYEFLSLLEDHFYKKFGISLPRLNLYQIRTSLAVVIGGSKFHSIRIHESSEVYFVVRHLTHLAQEINV